jgi:pimeloyl-ACP methyl ester carboxylesterase
MLSDPFRPPFSAILRPANRYHVPVRTAAPSPPLLRRIPGHGLTLAAREWNPEAPGEPLVLLHGITGSSFDWIPTAACLPHRRVIALDARGHGQSDWAPDEAYGGDQHFADLAIALDALEIERCTIAGFSMGGGVAMLAAACLPERVSRTVVIDTYPAARMTPGSRRIAHWVSAHADGSAWFDPAIARHFRDLLATGSDARLDLWSMWEAIDHPTLLVRGAQSDVLPADLAGEMTARQPLARLVEVPGVAHPIPFTRPAELAAAISTFLESPAP